MSLPRPAFVSLVSLVWLVSLAALAGCGGKIEPCVDGLCDPAAPSASSLPAPTSTPPAAARPSASAPAAEPDCPAPYMVEAPDGRCVWSCGEGTRPADDGQSVCVCVAGATQTGVDAFGRRVCR